MKKKQLLRLAALAKKALDAAKKAAAGTYSEQEIADLEADWQQKHTTAEAAPDDDEGADDEGEDATGAKKKKTKAAKGEDDEGAITDEELKDIIEGAVTNAVKKLQHKLSDDQIAAAAKAAVDAYRDSEGEDAELDSDAVKSIAAEALKNCLAKVQRKSKFAQAAADATEGGSQKKAHPQKTVDGQIVTDIERVFSWDSVDNLPTHGKQLLNVMMKRKADEGIDEADLKIAVKNGDRDISAMQSYARNLSRNGHAGKAMTSTSVGAGDELVPRDLSSELQRRIYLESEIAAWYAAREIAMPTQPYDVPLLTTDPDFYLETAENTATTESAPGTGSLVLDAKKIMGMVKYSYELDEDSILPILPIVLESLGKGAARGWEDALINGDTTATHMDSDIHAVSKHVAKSIKGFRKLALAVAALKKDLSSGGLNEANLRAMRKAMGKYGVNPRDLIWLCGPLGSNDLQAIANVTTLEKYGNRATILTGELAALFGIPIITSEKCRENLNADGVYDGATTTKGSILLVRPARFLVGRRRDFIIETDRDIETQTNKIVASFRKGMTPIETPSATVPTVVVGYNYTA